MKRQLSFTLTVLALLTASACDDGRQKPILCVVSPIPAAEAGKGALTLESAGCGALAADADIDADRTHCDLDISADGQGFVLLHKLPDGVTPIGKLAVHIDTPCADADQDVEVSYVNGLAVLTGVVPPGGQCALSISAVMANSELRCDFSAPATGTGEACTPVCAAQ